MIGWLRCRRWNSDNGSLSMHTIMARKAHSHHFRWELKRENRTKESNAQSAFERKDHRHLLRQDPSHGRNSRTLVQFWYEQTIGQKSAYTWCGTEKSATMNAPISLAFGLPFSCPCSSRWPPCVRRSPALMAFARYVDGSLQYCPVSPKTTQNENKMHEPTAFPAIYTKRSTPIYLSWQRCPTNVDKGKQPICVYDYWWMTAIGRRCLQTKYFIYSYYVVFNHKVVPCRNFDGKIFDRGEQFVRKVLVLFCNIP